MAAEESIRPSGSNTARVAALLGAVCANADLPRFTVPLRLYHSRLQTDCARAVPRSSRYCRAVDAVLAKVPVDPAAPQLDFSSVVLPALQRELPLRSPLVPLESFDDVAPEWTAPLRFEICKTNPAVGPPATPAVTAVLLELPGRMPPSSWYLLPTWAFREVRRASTSPVALTRPLPSLPGGATLVDLGSEAALLLPGDPAPAARRFLGVAAEYRPGQGLRLTGITEAKDLRAEVGAFGSGLAQLSWTRDLIGIHRLGIRLSLTVDGGSTTVAHRLLRGRDTDERRTGFGARVELEPVRDDSGHTLTVWAAPRRERVEFSGTAATVIRLDTGLDYTWRRRIALHPTLRSAEGWSVAKLDAEYHHPIRGTAAEAAAFVHTAWTTPQTPVFDQPSLGGPNTLRGFREDTLQCLRLLAIQTEVSVPLWRRIGFASHFDFAAAHGLRRGLGAGPRLRIGRAQIGLDYSFGFGPDAPARPGLLSVTLRTL